MMKETDYSDIDGNSRLKTQEAVKSFQQGINLTADEVVGPLTWKALPAGPHTPTLARGASGSAVSGLQKGLRAFGGASTATDPGPIDGSFGSRTESAVRVYQSQHDLTADGIVGDQTWWAPAGGAGATLASLAGLVTI
jgi:peptidoglycan hydrolase-like protein with peptidoglycan-binding domain